MKSKTPMQELIEAILYQPNKGVWCNAYREEIDLSKYVDEALAKERKAILDAYTDAQKEMVEVIAEVFLTHETIRAINEVLNCNDDNEDAVEWFKAKYGK